MVDDTPKPPGTVIKTTIMASIRDPAGRTWRDKGHAWDRDHAHKVLAACGAPAHHYEHGPTGHVQIRVPPGVDPDRLIERLRKHPHVANVEFDYLVDTCDVVSNYPPDPAIDGGKDKSIHRSDTLGALRYGFCDPSVRIASIDTGVKPHEDLYVLPENTWSCLNGVVTPGDGFVPGPGGAPHGLMTAGCIAATPNNGKGIAGPGYGCTLLVIRIADNSGAIPASNTVAGIYQAGNVGAHIVSMSLSTQWTAGNGGDAGPTALSWLASTGAVIVASAGNGGSAGPILWHVGSPPDGNSYAITKDAGTRWEVTLYNSPANIWPGSHADAFTVGACGTLSFDPSVPGDWFYNPDVRSAWRAASFLPPWSPVQQSPTQSSRGPRTRVAAPDGMVVLVGSWTTGTEVSSDYSGGGTGGTSFSAPYVAGTMGLVKTENPSLDRLQIMDIVQQSADAPLYPDGNVTPDILARLGSYASLYPAVPWTNHFPNAGILNVARARLKAWTTNPANAGLVRAYLHVIDDVNNPGVTYAGPTTTINGPCFIDVDGYSSDPITSVELWIGGLRLYSGAARRFYATGSSSGPAQRLRIVAKTATATADDTRSDIAVATLTCPDFDPVGIASVMSTGPQTFLVSGKMHAGTTVTLTGAGATVSGITYTDATSWQTTVTTASSDPTTLTATTSDGVTASATTDGPGEFAASTAFGAAIDAAYTVVGDASTYPARFASSLDALWDPPAEGSLVYSATNAALLDARYAESTDGPSFDARPGASIDAEWQPALAPSWLARVVMSGLSWVAGPFQPFTLNPATTLVYGAGFGASADARVDYQTWDGFGARIGASLDAAFGPAYATGTAFPWTAGAAFDADFNAAPPREADTDLWPRAIPLGLVATSRPVNIRCSSHPTNLRARHG